ncbi:uncharacterized protein MELLADRAFT_85055 [Melampsora larici-populina 98AG31]|uniref:Uncharacterized protein n=1 Tax=Melampsora larici-populina (strain 98AG31 / pathotype 3-4-7) TaxID=747676 RepID=F4RHB7_MELLP|nr:uncharacterized protein MELLADRAFT_85055 [Melampsora larici-populina 98AG31]EGG08239.1 hypothetical protein MELLADRAFT_85055 [Melampsora larici-populina 98AG31]
MSSSSTTDKVLSHTLHVAKTLPQESEYCLDEPSLSVTKAVNNLAGLQSPFSSPVSTRAGKVNGSSRRLVELSSEFTLAYSTPVRYHLPTRMRTKPEISCFESDDEDHKDHTSVKKALTLASDALAWCTRKRANSSITLKAFKHTDNKVQGHEVPDTTQIKTRTVIADQQHKVQWSGSTLNSVTEAHTSLVPMCRLTRKSRTFKRSGQAVDFGSGDKEAKMAQGASTSKWIEWYGSDPFEIEEVSRLSKLRPPGPPPNCPLPPLPTEVS